MKYYLEILKGPNRGHCLSLFEGEAFLGGEEGGQWVLQSAPPEKTNFRAYFEDGVLSLRAYHEGETFWLNEEQVHEAVIEPDQIVKFHDFIIQYRKIDTAKPVVKFGKLSPLQFTAILSISGLIVIQILVMLIFSWSWRAEDELGALYKAEQLEASLNPEGVETNSMDDMEAELAELAKMEVPEPEPEAQPEPVDEEPEELTADRAERMLDDGVKLWRERQLAEAERQFKRILQMDPTYVPAMVELAKLHQFRGMSEEALVYWEQVIEQGRDSEFYFKAVSEKSRIEQEQKRNSFARGITNEKPTSSDSAKSSALASQFDKYKDLRPAPKKTEEPPKEVPKETEVVKAEDSKPEKKPEIKKPEPKKPKVAIEKPQIEKPAKPVIEKPADPPKVVPPARPLLVIESTDVQRYLRNERFDEMRLLTVVLQSKSSKTRLAGKDFKVKVTFFDKNAKNDAVEETEVLVPDPSVNLEGRILPDDSPTVSFAYVVQKGYRAVQKKKTQKEMSYYGYLVEVHYRGRLIDRVAVPKSLAR